MYWDKENRIYFITYIPITYCNTVTSNCQIENETKKSSTNSIVRIDINNPNNLQALFTRKFTAVILEYYARKKSKEIRRI